MYLKSMVKAVTLSLTTALIFAACQHEAPSLPADKTLQDKALQDTAARSFDLSISTDVDLPAGLAKSTGRGARFVLEEGKHGHLRPRIDFALSSYHTKLYLRRKGSTDPKELFSVTIKDGEWQVRDVEGNKIHLGIGQNGKPHLRKLEPVMGGGIVAGFHPFDAREHYPKKEPLFGEEWEAAAIICKGDLHENPDPLMQGRIAHFPKGVFTPVEAIVRQLDPNFEEDWIPEGAANDPFNPSDPNLPFRQDGAWLVYPRVATYNYSSWDAYNEKRKNFEKLPQLYLELLKVFAARYDAYKADYAAHKSAYYREGEENLRTVIDKRAPRYKELAKSYEPKKENRSYYISLYSQYRTLFDQLKAMYPTGSVEQKRFIDTYSGEEKLLVEDYLDSFSSEMDIPFCADWTPVVIDEQKNGRPLLKIRLKAKSPGSILHYELSKAPEGARALSAPGRQTFRDASAAAGGDQAIKWLDNLETNAGTHYGALWYDQNGTTVHWKRGAWLDDYQDPNGNRYTYHRSMHNRLPIDGYRTGISQQALESGTVHILYFVMPPYEGESVTSPETSFWLSEKEWKVSGSGPYHAYQEKTSPTYMLRKGSTGAFESKYTNTTTTFKPNAIHYVSLQWQKQ